MKKSKLTLLLVLTLAALVPATGRAQAAPDAKAESGKAKAAPEKAAGKADKATDKAAGKVAKADSAEKADKPVALADGAPNTYTVVKGDTLWGIAGQFLKEPWRWPEIWNMNREQIKDPHWIYPGDVVKLTFDADGRPILSLAGGEGGFSGAPGSVVKLNPQIRTDKLSTAIPSIPSSAIGPFLSLPLVVEAGGLNSAPRIVAADDGRVVIGAGNVAYAVGVNPQAGVKWQIYRPGKPLVDPISNETLGYEATYLGDAKVTRFGESTTLEILRSTQEINRGDRLTPTLESTLPSYSPHSPDKMVKGYVISVLGGVADAAQYSVVALNLGKRDGMEIGHVLATLQRGEVVTTSDSEVSRGSWFNPSTWFSGLGSSSSSGDAAKTDTPKQEVSNIPSSVKLPDERNGLVFVFRVFDRVSYALVMSSRRSLKLGDVVQTP